MSDLTDILADPDFRTGDPALGYLVTRTAEPTFATGIGTAGATSTFYTGPAILRPLDGDDLKTLPEGYHAEDARKLLTTATLRTEPVPDVVTIDGAAWTVLRVATTTAFGGTHRRVMLARGLRT